MEVGRSLHYLDDDRARAGLLQRGVLDEEVLTVEDLATRDGGVQEFRPRFQTILLHIDLVLSLCGSIRAGSCGPHRTPGP